MRITCVIGNLGGGGAERMMTYLCGGLAVRGHQITLLTLDDTVPDFYTLPASVTRARVHLPSFRAAGIFGGMARLFKLTRALKETRPQVVISFMTISVLASCLLLHVPYIYADHLDVRHLTYSRKWEILRNFLLRFAHSVTVLSRRDLQFLQENHPGWRAQVVYNPALVPSKTEYARPAFMKPGCNYVLAVGRLTSQKGFDRLLPAWKTARKDGWRLAIIGGGEDEQKLKAQADKLGIATSVDFVPPQKEVFSAYVHAQILAMSSRAEGFPLVLLEAMALGVPAVSFNCTGPDVIIRHDMDGILVPQDDVSAFSAALTDLMQDEQKRRAFGERAREVTQRFSLENYLDDYERLCQTARLSA
ncbi:glycosyltransferase family 4 protein [Candidatus Avelusimicrobium luingense]|uniref:glycosyltransferase family 4 protein n=1 Tax=Candidatus Avelusimicrobium luingense TaxID=3416211 RepID=UPI003D0BDF48